MSGDQTVQAEGVLLRGTGGGRPRGILNDPPTTRMRQRGDSPKYANVERRHSWQQSRNVHGVVFMTLCAPHVVMTAADFMRNREGAKKPCKRCARAQGVRL